MYKNIHTVHVQSNIQLLTWHYTTAKCQCSHTVKPQLLLFFTGNVSKISLKTQMLYNKILCSGNE